MVLDQVANFVRVAVSGSHTSGDSTISLQSGEASTLPDTSGGKYNLVWYDSKNYRIPDKDPEVEIVRVNSVDTDNDTISVTRGQEDTSATAKDSTDAEYELLLGLTAKTIQEIDQFKLDTSSYSPEADTHDKTSSASELTDVSPDSTSDAHHSKYTDSDATSAVGASTPFANSDLSNSSVTIEGNSVSLGGSTSVNHNDLSSISSSDHHSKTSSASELTDVSPDSTTDAHHSKYTDSDAQSALENTSPTFTSVGITDFMWSQDNGDLVLSDGTVELIRQPKGGSTEFLQGIDAGPIEAPTDTLSQIINTPVTSALTSGDLVGYNFSVNSQKIASVEADADGSGGITNKRMDVDGDVNTSGEFVEDSNAL